MTALPSGQIRFHWRSSLLLAATSIAGIAAFTWPLFTRPRGSENLAHSGDAPWVFIALVPLLVAILLSELADGALDAKAVAMLGVLVACGAVLRAPTTGVTGFTGVFFLLIPGGRVFGRGFGFVQGALTMFASALLTGGVGPWLPFQMLCTAWVGFFAGVRPRHGHVVLAVRYVGNRAPLRRRRGDHRKLAQVLGLPPCQRTRFRPPARRGQCPPRSCRRDTSARRAPTSRTARRLRRARPFRCATTVTQVSEVCGRRSGPRGRVASSEAR